MRMILLYDDGLQEELGIENVQRELAQHGSPRTFRCELIGESKFSGHSTRLPCTLTGMSMPLSEQIIRDNIAQGKEGWTYTNKIATLHGVPVTYMDGSNVYEE